ncbi:hypothetical protein EsVE80_07260 [Enterococcus saigonensis]|uniref:Uncharacterized protein n=1 Tax=Enterococcus saigonensis TaxID=1805431 RepID=A0A679IA46_9ENTE|nr:hypothetical protein EsVE80_07260 [Enterococcus saigonensis]
MLFLGIFGALFQLCLIPLFIYCEKKEKKINKERKNEINRSFKKNQQ